MKEKLTKEYVKKIIFDAFRDVPKGNGIGARECNAIDDYASEEEQREISKLDKEDHWWQYPSDVVSSGMLDYSLIYNNTCGVKFHLPAVMTAEIDGYGTTAGISVFRVLCEPYTTIGIFQKQYIEYLRTINVSKIIEQYDFSDVQVHAMALYLLFIIHTDEYFGRFFLNQDQIIESAKREVEESSNIEGYDLSVEDVVLKVNEMKRIVCDWFREGGVEQDNYVFENNNSWIF